MRPGWLSSLFPGMFHGRSPFKFLFGGGDTESDAAELKEAYPKFVVDGMASVRERSADTFATRGRWNPCSGIVYETIYICRVSLVGRISKLAL
jgi:hypothetical protein